MSPTQPAITAAADVPHALPATRGCTARNTAVATNGSTNAMLRQLAPNVRMPPSPKSTAWSPSATDTAMQAASGPKSRATSAPPTAWPVVPPGSGTLNIMSRNENAAQMPRNETCSRESARRTWRTQWAQMGTIATAATASVWGER